MRQGRVFSAPRQQFYRSPRSHHGEVELRSQAVGREVERLLQAQPESADQTEPPAHRDSSPITAPTWPQGRCALALHSPARGYLSDDPSPHKHNDSRSWAHRRPSHLSPLQRSRCAPDAIASSWGPTATPAGTRDRSTRTTVGALQEITLSERHTRRSSARDAQGAASSAPAAPGVLPTWALPSLDHASRCRVEADISERSDLRLGPHKTIHELPPSDGVHDPIMALWITASDLAAAGRSVSLTR